MHLQGKVPRNVTSHIKEKTVRLRRAHDMADRSQCVRVGNVPSFLRALSTPLPNPTRPAPTRPAPYHHHNHQNFIISL